ncbi:ribosomal-processing cysteine protease Prp [Paenibacillus sediminis]|uniref:Ribosomal processing cysteine protease Prp n=1 Tax=Paenibacillus sediminis TaxID=664909 RepID=A0ABS4H719_9BACL|nr:ribosomal-processing cysteine protease Prp [Paenibacillus sediminis]MBP1938329.1 uncharacterized protein YsxB (DUF464 family) [Paenibacillus sediminis]
MIVVHILRNQDGKIRSFQIEGHAGYAIAGEDIVCAGISAVTVGTVNSIEALTGTVLNAKMKNGFLSGSVPRIQDAHTSDQVQLLLESMVVMLRSIEESYGKYIQIKEQTT